MKTITTFVSGLLLSAFLLLAPSVRAAELQPFFTLKASSINALVGVAEKIGGMAGFADSAEFREAVNTFKNMRGFDNNSIAGVAIAVSPTGDLSPILLLPINDLWRAEVPGRPDIFDSIRPFLVRRGEGRFDINSPFGTFVAVQKQEFLVITPEGIADQIPADARAFFADLEKYTLGIKLDLEKVEFETLEATLFGPMMLLVMMQNPEAAEQLENMVELYRELYNEFAALSFGIAFNSQTADVEVSGVIVPRKDSDFGKTLVGYKQLPTIFSGFRGTPNNIVFSLGDSVAQTPLENNAMMELNKQQWETILEGFLDQIAMEDETGELTKLAEAAVASILKIIEIESKRGTFDYALSLNTDGTLLSAFDTVSLAEIQKLAAQAAASAVKNVPESAKTLIGNNLNLGYTTVEGFRVSSVKIPVIAALELFAGSTPNDADAFRDLTLGVFWAVKEGDKQAIAVAVGLDFAKTEQAFKTALEQTKTVVPVQRPVGVVSIAGLGKLLDQAVYPIVVKAKDVPEGNIATFKKVIDIFTSAGSDATIAVDADTKPDRIDWELRVSGKVIQAIVSAAMSFRQSNW